MYFSEHGIYVLVGLLSGVCSIGGLDVVVVGWDLVVDLLWIWGRGVASGLQ